jgi:hypothetical protein
MICVLSDLINNKLERVTNPNSQRLSLPEEAEYYKKEISEKGIAVKSYLWMDEYENDVCIIFTFSWERRKYEAQS